MLKSYYYSTALVICSHLIVEDLLLQVGYGKSVSTYRIVNV